MSSMHETDVAIIGAGPVGLFAIFQCGMMRLKCHVIDALDVPGGQCAALYPEKPIYDIPAYPQLTGRALVENLKAQAAPFDPVYHLSQRVEALSCDGGLWTLETSQGTRLRAKVVIIAAGVGAFGPNRPPLDGIKDYEGTSVFYHVYDPTVFEKKRIVIAGGGDSAVDWALALCDKAAHIYMVHRRDKFRAAPESVASLHKKVEEGKIHLVTPYQLKALHGSGGQLSQVIVANLEGEERALDAQILLPFFGLSMNLGPIATWGLDLKKNHIAVDRFTNETTSPGLFAIGDVATYDHKLKLILTGFAEAAQAAHRARQHIHPHEVWHFEYSTTQGIPTEHEGVA